MDEQANVVETYDYYPFGKTMRSTITDNVGTINKFTGKELDDEGDLNWYYFGGRYYDANIMENTRYLIGCKASDTKNLK